MHVNKMFYLKSLCIFLLSRVNISLARKCKFIHAYHKTVRHVFIKYNT